MRDLIRGEIERRLRAAGVDVSGGDGPSEAVWMVERAKLDALVEAGDVPVSGGAPSVDSIGVGGVAARPWAVPADRGGLRGCSVDAAWYAAFSLFGAFRQRFYKGLGRVQEQAGVGLAGCGDRQ